VEDLYELLGNEMIKNNIDTLLGPGINIHRNPLNGRNFEYFSEDPIVTGYIASAIVRGIGKSGAVATVKHFACNNRERARDKINSIVSERALREIYLKGFEIVVKEGKATSIMTAYNAVNGYWSASNYDLTTTILRNEWKYQGIVMTDWWAKMNDAIKGGDADRNNTASMIRAQNDIYMVVDNDGAEMNASGDNTLSALKNGQLELAELQRNAINICSFLMKLPAYSLKRKFKEKIYTCTALKECSTKMAITIKDTAEIPAKINNPYFINVEVDGIFRISGRFLCKDLITAQISCNLIINDEIINSFKVCGTEGRWSNKYLAKLSLSQGIYKVQIECKVDNVELDRINLTHI